MGKIVSRATVKYNPDGDRISATLYIDNHPICEITAFNQAQNDPTVELIQFIKGCFNTPNPTEEKLPPPPDFGTELKKL